jgi:mono/diheme cytochrome c family protein
MRSLTRLFFAGIGAAAFVAVGMTPVSVVHAADKPSAAELDKAKKEGDLSVEQAEKTREAYGNEADAAGAVNWGGKSGTGSGKSTYGVVGFDYLTGVGKVASDPSAIGADLPAALGGGKIVNANKSPLADLQKKRYAHKWTGQLGDTQSGWSEKSGVTEAWFRTGESGSKLGANYNQWVNQWNNITRPRFDKTPVVGADPDQGAHWFSFFCVHCHGWSGKGDGPTAATLDPRPRNLTNGKYANYVSNLDLFRVVKGGGAARNLAEAMPPWGNVLQDQDIWNVVAFIRSLADKPKYAGSADEVTAASASSSKAFKEMNEELELEGVMAGRGGGQKGGFSSIGGGRLASKHVGVTTGSSGGKSENKDSMMGDWAEDTK